MTLFAQLFLLAVGFIALSVTSSQKSPIVTTKTGKLQGQLIRLAPNLEVYQFTGIPFAESPTGPRRFRKPVPKQPWQGILDATKTPNACPQLLFLNLDPVLSKNQAIKALTPKGHLSEDCLQLNMWVPKAALDNKLHEPMAVYIFIHGGIFTMGGISIDLFNGTVLAALNNVIVATIQYRLGSLGFAYLGNEQVPGNMGLWDQLEAMKWLCENVASFGGNCNETTLGGESAGSSSVTLHLVSPYSRPYFKRAIIESGTANTPWTLRSAVTAKAGTSLIFKGITETECHLATSQNEIIACLRHVDVDLFPVADVMASLRGVFIGPVIDGDFIPENPEKMFESGNFHQVPILIGTNKDEGSMFVLISPAARQLLPLQPGPVADNNNKIDGLNYNHFTLLLQGTFKLFAPNLLEPRLFRTVQNHYGWSLQNSRGGGETVKAAVAAIGDHFLTCPSQNWTMTVSTFNKMGSQIYAYYFSQRRSGHPLPDWVGVMHGEELQFVFGEPFSPHASRYGYSNDDRLVSRIVMAYWTNFIKYGDPNVKDVRTPKLPLRHWPNYVGSNCRDRTFEINSTSLFSNKTDNGIICGMKSRDCLFWQSTVPKLTMALSTS